MKHLIEHIREYGLYVLLFLLPWQTRWIINQGLLSGGEWEYGSYSLYAFDILFVVLLLLTVVSHAKRHPSARWWPTLLGLGAVALVSISFASNHGVAWYHVARLWQAIALVWIIGRTHISMVRAMAVLILAGVAQAGLGIYQFYSQHIIANTWLGLASHDPGILGDAVVETAAGRFLRAYGSLPHPNMLGGFLAVGCLLAIGGLCYLFRKKSLPRWWLVVLAWLAFGIQFVGLLLTYSRSAWLAFAVGLVIFGTATVVTRHRGYRHVMMMAAVWIVLLTAWNVATFPALWQTRLTGEGRLEAQSVTERRQYYEEAWSLFIDSSIVGTGIGNYTQALQEEVPNREAWDYQPVHNVYLLIAVELGVFGFALFGWLLWQYLRAFWWQRLHEIVRQPLALGVGVSLVSLLVIGLFDHYWWTLASGSLLFWAVLALGEREAE